MCPARAAALGGVFFLLGFSAVAEPGAPSEFIGIGDRAVLATAAGELSARAENGADGRVLTLWLTSADGNPLTARLPVAENQRHRLVLRALDPHRRDLMIEIAGLENAVRLVVDSKAGADTLSSLTASQAVQR